LLERPFRTVAVVPRRLHVLPVAALLLLAG
jgi:hypothetical protein